MSAAGPSYYEFFAGGGMVRAGLGPGWTCRLANDFDPKKAASYAANWGAEALRVCDVRALGPADLPGRADLAWASFPCQDLSLAGGGAGLGGARSGTFWAFMDLVRALGAQGRGPALVALENVCGTLSARGGRDFAAIGAALAGAGYRFGALAIDAVRFVPQSRPRLFVVGLRADLVPPPELVAPAPVAAWSPPALLRAQAGLDEAARRAWLWWRLPEPPPRRAALADLIEPDPEDAPWRPAEATARLLALMTPAHRARVEAARTAQGRMVGTVYRRTRPDGAGGRVQRAEVRFDGVAGCLRTPAGGSSRQTLLAAEAGRVRTRLLSRREAARLMGLPDGYVLPRSATDAYHLLGDGVAAPVAAHLRAALFEPLLARTAAPEFRRDGALRGSLSPAI